MLQYALLQFHVNANVSAVDNSLVTYRAGLITHTTLAERLHLIAQSLAMIPPIPTSIPDPRPTLPPTSAFVSKTASAQAPRMADAQHEQSPLQPRFNFQLPALLQAPALPQTPPAQIQAVQAHVSANSQAPAVTGQSAPQQNQQPTSDIAQLLLQRLHHVLRAPGAAGNPNSAPPPPHPQLQPTARPTPASRPVHTAAAPPTAAKSGLGPNEHAILLDSLKQAYRRKLICCRNCENKGLATSNWDCITAISEAVSTCGTHCVDGLPFFDRSIFRSSNFKLVAHDVTSQIACRKPVICAGVASLRHCRPRLGDSRAFAAARTLASPRSSSHTRLCTPTCSPSAVLCATRASPAATACAPIEPSTRRPQRPPLPSNLCLRRHHSIDPDFVCFVCCV